MTCSNCGGQLCVGCVFRDPHHDCEHDCPECRVGHEFVPLHFGDAVTASCSCRWISGYSHAFEKYAAEDHDFHLQHTE